MKTLRMLHLLLLACLLFKAVSSQITASGDVTAHFGGDAHYGCVLADPAGVQQVIWERRKGDSSKEHLATFSKRFGTQIDGNVIFKEASLGSTSITVQNVTWGDEGCYICSFHVYPSGSKKKQTCLTVQGISEANAHAQNSESHDEADPEVVFSCSATGKPAPVIQWNTTTAGVHLNEPSHRTVLNDDNTFTTSSNVTGRLSSPRSGGFVDCLINTGAAGQRRERIHVLPGGDVQEEEEEGGNSGLIVAVIVIVCIATGCVVALKLRRGCKTAAVVCEEVV